MPSLLLLNYIKEFPAEVAAQLEGKPVPMVLELFDELSDTDTAYLIPYLSLKYLTHLTNRINADVIGVLSKTQPPYVVSRIFSAFAANDRERYLPLLPRRFRWHIEYIQSQPKYSITTLMTYDFLSIQENLKIIDLEKIMKNSNDKIIAVYTHNDKNKVTGELDLRSLFTNDHDSLLADHAKPIRFSQPPSANIDDVVNLRIWGKQSTLPIIDHSQILLGIVLINTLFETLVKNENEFKLSLYDGAERLSNSIYTVLNSLALSYIKKD